MIEPTRSSGLIRPDFGILVPDRMHPRAEHVGNRLAAWATRVGLTTGTAEDTRLRRSGFHLVAARILPDEGEADVELFAQWATWLFHLDDEQDEGVMGRSPQSVHATYTAIIAIIQGRPTPAAAHSPAVRALADLWPRTAARMSPAWRSRILDHVHQHRDAFLTQITHRQTGTLPTPEDYPGLRRDANGMFMYDLVEVTCHTEIPPHLAGTSAWTELCAASSDITAWCNDVISLPREQANNEPTNYVTVLRHAHGCGEQEAVDQVRAHITRRLRDLREAERAVLTEARQHKPGTDRLHRVVRIIGDMPGTHLGWILTSGRYR
ncbi:terpene synthase family protein [Streptomyces sp. 378]|uniref:terpene synthase family protein n=1 Tax=Streptomyces sp. 378 TaxID=3049412 RepID=UPI0024C291BF|nr:terpene synthase family protein [Streptomyces sp. 378]MDK1347693.1 terpene synthase family protein [Streptomyces sp. 378]